MTGHLTASGVRPRRRTDLGNAERLVDRHGEDLHYIPQWKSWLVWDGVRWAVDEAGLVHARAKDTVRAIYTEASHAPDDDERRALVQHAVASESNARVRAMIERAQYESGVSVHHRDLDTDPWLLTVANGTVDLRTGTLRPHRRADRITKRIAVPFRDDAPCPRWLAFLDRILGGRSELASFLQRAVGYSLSGDTSEQVLFFLHGAGANGKSTFLEVLRSALGEYAVQADFATFLERRYADGPRNDIARLEGARLVTSSEVGEARRLDESVVKTLTGGDTVTARRLYQEPVEFVPQCKFWLAANHKPVIRGTDDAIWRRIRLIPFTVQIPEPERDPRLVWALRAELPGILAWAVQGCLAWLEQGLGAPADVREATAAYRAESDTLGSFLAECCLVRVGDVSLRAPASALYAAYRRWAEASGEVACSQHAFGRQLEERGIAKVKAGTVFRVGIELTPASRDERRPADAGPLDDCGPFSGKFPLSPSYAENPGKRSERSERSSAWALPDDDPGRLNGRNGPARVLSAEEERALLEASERGSPP